MRREKLHLLPAIVMGLGLILTNILPAQEDEGTVSNEGKTQEAAIVLVPFPFNQEMGPYTITDDNDVCWFLFYLNKDMTYSFSFTEDSGQGTVKAEIIDPNQATLKTYERKIKDEKSGLMAFQIKENIEGNYYIKLTTKKKGSWTGSIKFLYNDKDQTIETHKETRL